VPGCLNRSFKDGILTVDTINLSGNADTGTAIFWRYVDKDNNKILMFTTAGHYIITKGNQYIYIPNITWE
jgi:hypothetical protein